MVTRVSRYFVAPVCNLIFQHRHPVAKDSVPVSRWYGALCAVSSGHKQQLNWWRMSFACLQTSLEVNVDLHLFLEKQLRQVGSSQEEHCKVPTSRDAS